MATRTIKRAASSASASIEQQIAAAVAAALKGAPAPATAPAPARERYAAVRWLELEVGHGIIAMVKDRPLYVWRSRRGTHAAFDRPTGVVF